jgi:Secretion system C-terminal sorting domain
MFKFIYICLMVIICFNLTPAFVTAQEFAIAAGRDSTFAGGAAFDGTNFLIGILGDTLDASDLTAQLVSTNGSLVGQRISIGATGGWPQIAFDGSNYLMVWSDAANIVYGQFISTAGSLVGTRFVIASSASFSGPQGGALAFGDTIYMVMYQSNGVTYGQRVGKSGNLIGAPTQITGAMHDDAMAFGGSNFLIAWDAASDQKIVYGQFISASGNLVGSNFVIDGSPNSSDNPLSIAFDGSRYMVCFHDDASLSAPGWNLIARFVTTDGTVSDRDTIVDVSYNPIFPMVAFDGTNYLVVWSEYFTSPDSAQCKGRFFNTSGVPIDSAFTLFDTLGGKVPLFTGPIFGGDKYLAVTTRVRLSVSGDGQLGFTDGDVYGRFINPITTGVKESEGNRVPKGFSLSQNYPNPFNPMTTISFDLLSRTFISLKIFDLLGRAVSTIVSGELGAGSYTRQWNATNMPSGIYFYRLQAGPFSETRKLLLLK